MEVATHELYKLCSRELPEVVTLTLPSFRYNGLVLELLQDLNPSHRSRIKATSNVFLLLYLPKTKVG